MKKIIPLLSIVALPMVALNAQAATDTDTGTINFTGEIIAATCDVNVAGSSSNTATVTLPAVSTNSLMSAGAVAGQTNFEIAMTGCTAGEEVSVYFNGGADVNATDGTLVNTGDAGNVVLQLNDAVSNLPISAGDANQSADNTWVTSDTTGNAILNYMVEYKAVGAAATAGSVESAVTYNIMYK